MLLHKSWKQLVYVSFFLLFFVWKKDESRTKLKCHINLTTHPSINIFYLYFLFYLRICVCILTLFHNEISMNSFLWNCTVVNTQCAHHKKLNADKDSKEKRTKKNKRKKQNAFGISCRWSISVSRMLFTCNIEEKTNGLLQIGLISLILFPFIAIFIPFALALLLLPCFLLQRNNNKKWKMFTLVSEKCLFREMRQ